jgi:hypothetical protein
MKDFKERYDSEAENPVTGYLFLSCIASRSDGD